MMFLYSTGSAGLSISFWVWESYSVLFVKTDMSAVNVPVGSGWEEKQPCNYRDQWNIVCSNHSYFGVFILQYAIP